MNYVNGKDLSRYSQVGVVTPDHIIRTKHIPLLLSEPILSDKNKFKEEASIAVKKFVKEYKIELEWIAYVANGAQAACIVKNIGVNDGWRYNFWIFKWRSKKAK